jgi:integrase/recombinase XerD
MTNYNPENERIKKAYFVYLKEADQKSNTTINGIRKAILRLEEYTKFKSFKTFNKEQAIAFKKHLKSKTGERSGTPLAKATILSTINALKSFFGWLRFQAGYKTSIKVLEIDYLNMSEKEIRAAKAPKRKSFPSIEQIRKVIFSMPISSDIEKRDRALIAFTFLTGMRDSAIISLQLKHIDLSREYVNQNPNDVKTKFSKQIDTFLLPVGDDIKAIFIDWVIFLKETLLFDMNGPLFPQTRLGQDKTMSFAPKGLDTKPWSTASSMRGIFKKAFENVGLPYFTPHLFRYTLVHLGEEKCTTPEEFKAWSQNLGHENTLTTFNSYGYVDHHRQGDLIKGLGNKKNEENKLDAIYAHLLQNK